MTENDKLDYRRATNWNYQIDLGSKDRVYYYEGRKTGYVEEDGNSSPRENYANNIEYYIYTPDKLKKVTPQAFEWIQKKYGKSINIRREVK